MLCHETQNKEEMQKSNQLSIAEDTYSHSHSVIYGVRTCGTDHLGVRGTDHRYGPLLDEKSVDFFASFLAKNQIKLKRGYWRYGPL